MPFIDRVSRPETGESPATVDRLGQQRTLRILRISQYIDLFIFAGGSAPPEYRSSNRNLNLNLIAYAYMYMYEYTNLLDSCGMLQVHA